MTPERPRDADRTGRGRDETGPDGVGTPSAGAENGSAGTGTNTAASRGPGAAPTGPPVTRRSFLRAAAGAAATGASGCLGRGRAGRPPSSARVSLSIKTTPADDDPYAIRIAQRLADHLAAVGIDVAVVPMRNDRLLQDVLVDQAFDLSVAVHPGGTDPDFLFPLLHSRYADDPGWANPFGYADGPTDDLLERGRRLAGEERREAVAELQHRIAATQPFSVVALPDAIGAVRAGRGGGWRSAEGVPAFRDLALRAEGASAGSSDRPDAGSSDRRESRSSERTATATPAGERRTLRVALTDGRATQNLNPLAVPFRNRGNVTDLLYDPLVRQYGDDVVPWLAASWRWERREDRSGPVAIVRLREDLDWHDGRPVTADDVAFTYRFLADTSLGKAERPVPAPRFTAGESLVAGVEPLDARRARLEFAPVTPDVAIRALSVPILPEHEWRPLSGPAKLAGIDLFDGTTEALVHANMDPVGSGPFRFRRAVKDETLLLDRFEDHVAWHGAAGVPDRLAGDAPYDRLAFRIVPSDGAAVELLDAGQVDATGRSIHARAVPAAARSDAVRLIVRPTTAFYHVGFNTRTAPLSDPGFRRAVARLVDKGHVVADVFGGYARPATSPLAGGEWLPPDLDWTGRDPEVPFVGEAGRLDADRARSTFEDAGYRYDGSGRLLR